MVTWAFESGLLVPVLSVAADTAPLREPSQKVPEQEYPHGFFLLH